MRVVNQITFTANDDAEALRIASERLGRDAVILSTQMIKEGGVFGLFKKSVLKVTAGLLEEDSQQSTSKSKSKSPTLNPSANNSAISEMDDQTRRENLIAFQRLMEFKERSISNTLPKKPQVSSQPSINPPETGNEGYILHGDDNVLISSEGLKNAYGINSKPSNVIEQPLRPQSVQPNITNQLPQNEFKNNNSLSNDDAKILKEQVGALADRIDFLLQRLSSIESGIKNNPQSINNTFQPGISVSLSPEDAEIESRLKSSEVDDKYIRKLLADYSLSRRDTKQKKMSFTKWLASRIECSADNSNDPVGGRKIMLLGPTGVGKTTTIAKLAAIKALWEHKKVLLLTSDTYRIAAVEQLKTYAKILGVPIEIVFDNNAIPGIVDEHENAEIILLDTAGRSQRDKKNMQLFESLYNSFKPDAVHLVLAANMKYNDMLDVVEHIPAVPVPHLLFTKLDETVSCGSIFNIQQVMGCPISFLTVGQNVPRDIETATGSRIAEFLMKPESERKK